MLPLLIACATPDKPVETTPPDLTERLGPDAVRAGVVTDASVLPGGISAEGAVGDVLLYNDRVKFVVEAAGDSSFYVEYGGGLIDADLVRDDGVPGRDIIDELTPMVGLGRVVDAETVTVLEDGADGTAIVRVEGRAAPMQLITGALESDAVVPDLDLRVRTDFALAPGAWSVRATTTVWNDEDADVTLQIGEVALLALDIVDTWRPGTGRGEADATATDWVGALAHQNEVALVIAGDDTPLESGTVGRLLGSLAPAISGFGPTTTLAPSASATWSRWIGVAPDLATLTGAQLERSGAAARVVSGTVTAGGPVAGARVHVLDRAGAPLTVAFTDDAGAWSATVPEGAASYVASGRGPGYVVDLPPGHGWLSPYEPNPAVTLASIGAGAAPIPFAEGYGVSTPSFATDLTLTAPGTLQVTTRDGGPAVVRAYFASGDPVVADDRLVPGRPSGAAVIGYVRDGALALPLEPGTYDVIVHRGLRDEVVRETVTVTSGGTATLDADVVAAYTLDGVVVIDPHSHGSPSGDGGLPMADRLLVAAANGVEVHVGTDHDHVADYRPLLAPMGLEGRLQSIVATEVSPVRRGHFNVWPARPGPGPNGGAPQWWLGYADTREIFGWMRTLAAPEGGIVQANHPVGDSGMFSFAEYNAAGSVGRADAWSADFDAMELLNSGDWSVNLPYYLDLVSRGKLVTPVGVSDSHSYTSGNVGLNVTFVDVGVPLADLDEAALLAGMARRATVVSHGPYIDARVDGAWAPGAVVGAGSTLDVSVKAPSWMPVETVTLYENGVPVAEEACAGTAPTPCAARFLLTPLTDAAYVVIAASTTRTMEGGYPGNLSWAATSATLVDIAGDGWEPPLPAITVDD